MKKTKLIAAISAFLAVCVLLPCTVFAEAFSYRDVPRSHWAYDSIMKLSADGTLEGREHHTVFEPSAKLLPGELFAALYRLADDKTITPSFDFCGNLAESPASPSDKYGTSLYSGKWFGDYIFWAAYNGLLPVTANRLGTLSELGTYRVGSASASLPPVGETLTNEAYYITVDAGISADGKHSEPLTRTDIVTALYLYAEKYLDAVAPDASVLDEYHDGSLVPNADTPIEKSFPVTPIYANLATVGEGDLPTAAWSWAVENEIVIGYPDKTLCPGARLTRAEYAVLLDRFIAYAK